MTFCFSKHAKNMFERNQFTFYNFNNGAEPYKSFALFFIDPEILLGYSTTQ